MEDFRDNLANTMWMDYINGRNTRYVFSCLSSYSFIRNLLNNSMPPPMSNNVGKFPYFFLLWPAEGSFEFNREHFDGLNDMFAVLDGIIPNLSIKYNHFVYLHSSLVLFEWGRKLFKVIDGAFC